MAEPAPDLVFVELGANDHWNGDPGPAFLPAYTAFLERVRAAYPHARVYPVAWRGHGAAVPDAIVLEAPPKGHGRGCVGHPNAKTQAWIAAQLIERVCRDAKDAFCGGVAAR